MRLIGPHKIYIRDRETPIFPSHSVKYPTDGHIVTPSKNGFGGYLGSITKHDPKSCPKYCQHNPVYTITGAYGDSLGLRIEVKREASYTIWDVGEEVFACLAYTKGRVYYGATFGEGMIINFDGGFEEYSEYEGYSKRYLAWMNRQDACEEAIRRAWVQAEECAKNLADQLAEEREEDIQEQNEENEREEAENNLLREKAREIAKSMPLPPGVEVNKLSEVQLVNDNASAYVYATYALRVDFEKE